MSDYQMFVCLPFKPGSLLDPPYIPPPNWDNNPQAVRSTDSTDELIEDDFSFCGLLGSVCSLQETDYNILNPVVSGQGWYNLPVVISQPFAWELTVYKPKPKGTIFWKCILEFFLYFKLITMFLSNKGLLCKIYH